MPTGIPLLYTYVEMVVEQCGHVMECISQCAWHFLCTLSTSAFIEPSLCTSVEWEMNLDCTFASHTKLVYTGCKTAVSQFTHGMAMYLWLHITHRKQCMHPLICQRCILSLMYSCNNYGLFNELLNIETVAVTADVYVHSCPAMQVEMTICIHVHPTEQHTVMIVQNINTACI